MVLTQWQFMGVEIHGTYLVAVHGSGNTRYLPGGSSWEWQYMVLTRWQFMGVAVHGTYPVAVHGSTQVERQLLHGPAAQRLFFPLAGEEAEFPLLLIAQPAAVAHLKGN